MDISKTLRANRIVPDPGYYSGRGLNEGDLPLKSIIAIGQAVDPEHRAAYVAMVEALPIISATAFIRSLFNLAYSDWVFSGKPAGGVEVNNEGQGFATVAHALTADKGKAKRDAATSEHWKRQVRAVLIDGEPLDAWRGLHFLRCEDWINR